MGLHKGLHKSRSPDINLVSRFGLLICFCAEKWLFRMRAADMVSLPNTYPPFFAGEHAHIL
jgi:hypothetical protein